MGLCLEDLPCHIRGWLERRSIDRLVGRIIYSPISIWILLRRPPDSDTEPRRQVGRRRLGRICRSHELGRRFRSPLWGLRLSRPLYFRRGGVLGNRQLARLRSLQRRDEHKEHLAWARTPLPCYLQVVEPSLPSLRSNRPASPLFSAPRLGRDASIARQGS